MDVGRLPAARFYLRPVTDTTLVGCTMPSFPKEARTVAIIAKHDRDQCCPRPFSLQRVPSRYSVVPTMAGYCVGRDRRHRDHPFQCNAPLHWRLIRSETYGIYASLLGIFDFWPYLSGACSSLLAPERRRRNLSNSAASKMLATPTAQMPTSPKVRGWV